MVKIVLFHYVCTESVGDEETTFFMRFIFVLFNIVPDSHSIDLPDYLIENIVLLVVSDNWIYNTLSKIHMLGFIINRSLYYSIDKHG